MKSHFKSVVAVLALPLLLSVGFCCQSTDQEAWDFIMYLYGFDEEETENLLAMSPVERETLIIHTKKIHKDSSREAKEEFPLKSPENFSKEEKKFWDFIKFSYKRSKVETQVAKNKAEALNENDIRVTMALGLRLMEKHPDKSYQYQKYPDLNEIPQEWGFLDPNALYVNSGCVEVWLYRNAFLYDAPQIYFSIRRNDDDTISMKYYETLERVVKEWKDIAIE